MTNFPETALLFEKRGYMFIKLCLIQ